MTEFFALLFAPIFVPIFVVVLAAIFIVAAHTQKMACEKLRRASEIEGRLQD